MPGTPTRKWVLFHPQAAHIQKLCSADDGLTPQKLQVAYHKYLSYEWCQMSSHHQNLYIPPACLHGSKTNCAALPDGQALRPIGTGCSVHGTLQRILSTC